MITTGEVTAVRGDFLEITFCRPSECEHCHACLGGEAKRVLNLKGKAQVGDAAVVEMPAQTIAKASAIAYVFPLLALLAGMFLGTRLFPAQQDMGALGVGAVCLCIALVIIAVTEKKRRGKAEWQPQLIKIIPLKPVKGE